MSYGGFNFPLLTRTLILVSVMNSIRVKSITFQSDRPHSFTLYFPLSEIPCQIQYKLHIIDKRIIKEYILHCILNFSALNIQVTGYVYIDPTL